ncbi:MAG: asparagine synthase (glutamine-hydrolyzing) [Chitinophagales bacterium]
MCGILGVYDSRFDCEVNRSIELSQVLNKLYTRGPDDYGWLTWDKENGFIKDGDTSLKDSRLFLGHRRLSILDLSEAGRQPLGTVDGRYQIVFNGEIYNYRELKEELKEHGYLFKTECDTEVLLVAYQCWGKSVLNKLLGMFAFAIFDSKKGTLFLARDHFGIKPLFYSVWESGFAFASEIKPLLELPQVGKNLNCQKVYEYLQFGTTDNTELTLISDVKQLLGASYLELDINNPQENDPRKYWTVDCRRNLKLGYRQCVQRLRELFLNSVKLHLRSDVPVGAALSGGIDSSAIVCAIRYLKPESEIHTFTYITDESVLSEEKWADKVGEYTNAIMHKVKLSPEELVNDIDFLIQIQGEPFGSTSIYAQNRIFRLAQETGIKVMLDGQGADELLGGYSGYAGARLASLIQRRQWIGSYNFLKNAANWPGRSYSMILMRALNYFLPHWIQPVARTLAGRELRSRWLNKDWIKFEDLRFALPDWKKNRYYCLREQLLYSLQNASIPSLLRTEDRNSMAYSIESRVPFLNHKLVDFIFSVPEEYLINNQGVSKAIFRDAMKGIVPEEILNRKDKMGFVTPEFAWMIQLSPWVEDVLSKASDSQILNYKEIDREWRAIVNGDREFGWHIWRWINFLRWAEQMQVDGY